MISYICLYLSKYEAWGNHASYLPKYEGQGNNSFQILILQQKSGKRASLEVLTSKPRYRMQCGKPAKLFLRLAWKSNSFFSGIKRRNAQQSLVVLNERNMLNFIDIRAFAIELHYCFFKKETVRFIFIFLMQNMITFMVIRTCWKPSLHKKWEGLG